jgi:phage terminase small subunit
VIVSPKGDVVGERIVPNPAEQQLRRIDKALDAVTAALGLSPTSRARLGVAASDGAILSARWAS